MNLKRFSTAMGELDDKYIDEAIIFDMRSLKKTNRKLKRIVILAAAILAVMAVCGFAAYELGWFDPWLQKPSSNPVETVQSAIEGQFDKPYTISGHIDTIVIDEKRTQDIRQQYMGSELASLRAWSDEYIEKHFIVVKASYYVEYDHTKTFLDDGYVEQYFYLAENLENEEWEIVDNTGSYTLEQ